MDYALDQWTSQQVFLNDGRIEIDNNLAAAGSIRMGLPLHLHIINVVAYMLRHSRLLRHRTVKRWLMHRLPWNGGERKLSEGASAGEPSLTVFRGVVF